MSAPYPFPYKSVACTFLLLWVFVFLSADLFAGSYRTLGIKEGLGLSLIHILQEVVGNQYGDRYYPSMSGVARSLNYYPIGDERCV